MADGRETELKIPVTDRCAVRRRLEAVGAVRLHPDARETNLLLDTADRRLGRHGCALRLRRYGGRAWLTFKGPATWHEAVKSRHETETVVEDADAAERILEQLGYRPVLRYEKDRERWRSGAVTVELDRTPLGEFVELEGPRDALAAAAEDLRLDPARAVRESYIALWRRHRADHPELDLPEDMVMP